MLKELNTKAIKYVGLHHFGGTLANRYFKTQNLSEERIESSHSARWDFASKLNGSNIGYNIIIWADGQAKQYRYIGEETASQANHNHDTISICLAGNFTLRGGEPVETPTEAQIKTLTEILEYIYENYKIKLPNIKAHRAFMYANTECYGTALTNEWGRQLLVPYLTTKLKKMKTLLKLYMKLLNLLEKVKPHRFGGFERSCEGHI